MKAGCKRAKSAAEGYEGYTLSPCGSDEFNPNLKHLPLKVTGYTFFPLTTRLGRAATCVRYGLPSPPFAPKAVPVVKLAASEARVT